MTSRSVTGAARRSRFVNGGAAPAQGGSRSTTVANLPRKVDCSALPLTPVAARNLPGNEWSSPAAFPQMVIRLYCHDYVRGIVLSDA